MPEIARIPLHRRHAAGQPQDDDQTPRGFPDGACRFSWRPTSIDAGPAAAGGVYSSGLFWSFMIPVRPSPSRRRRGLDGNSPQSGARPEASGRLNTWVVRSCSGRPQTTTTVANLDGRSDYVVNNPVFIYLGTYPNQAAAQADYDIVKDLFVAEGHRYLRCRGAH